MAGYKVKKAHQRSIRDAEQKKHPRPVEANLDGAVVRSISVDEATPFILRYEWLGSMSSIPQACYGLFTKANGLTSVTVFGMGGGTQSHDLCGREHRHKVICLERGANAHWASKNAGSYITAHACRLACAEHGWEIFYAYSDPRAGEIGTIYQAANWHYIGTTRTAEQQGKATQRQHWRYPDGTFITSRTMRRWFGGAEVARFAGLVPEWQPDRARYVHFERNKKRWRRLLRYNILPYPKRAEMTRLNHCWHRKKRCRLPHMVHGRFIAISVLRVRFGGSGTFPILSLLRRNW